MRAKGRHVRGRRHLVGAAAGCAAVTVVTASGLAVGLGGGGPAITAAAYVRGQSNPGAPSGVRVAPKGAPAPAVGGPAAVLPSASYVGGRGGRPRGQPRRAGARRGAYAPPPP